MATDSYRYPNGHRLPLLAIDRRCLHLTAADCRRIAATRSLTVWEPLEALGTTLALLRPQTTEERLRAAKPGARASRPPPPVARMAQAEAGGGGGGGSASGSGCEWQLDGKPLVGRDWRMGEAAAESLRGSSQLR